jgi:CubicO group peptidase (beta-lactamase class C family)
MSRLRLDLPPESIVGLVRARPADFPPGQQFRYSNTGYVLLGMVIERASGEPYAEYLARHEAEPLGLGDTRYCGNRPIVPRRAHGYVEDSTGIVNADYISMTIPFSAGSLCSSVGDLIAWQRALWADRLLQPGGYNSMTTPPRLANGSTSPYGFGLGVGTLGTHRQVAHSGGITGFSSALYTWPDDSLIVVVLTNTEDANASRLAQRIARLVFDIPEPAVRDLPLTAAERAPYEGAYQLRTLRLRVFSRGDSLFAQAEGQSAFRLLAQGGHDFVAAFDPDTHATFEVEGGRARALAWTQGGVTTRAPRVD